MSVQLERSARIADSHVFDLDMSWRGLRINKMCDAVSSAPLQETL